MERTTPKKLFRAALIIFGAALMLDTLLVQTLCNLNFGVIMPAIIGAPLFILGVFFWPLTRFMRENIFGRIIKWLMIAAYGAFAALFTLTTGLCIGSASDEPEPGADVLIVLGAGIRDERVSLTLARRLDKTIEYIRESPETLVIVSGGKGLDEPMSEALAMKQYLVAHGIDEQRIIMEDKSESTQENFAFSKRIIDEMGGEKRICFVTTSSHIYRARRVAATQGIDAKGLGAPSVWYIALNEYMRECAAITYYLLSGQL